MISFKQAIGWVQPRGQQDIKLWDDTISAVNKSPIIGKADLGFISSITSINKLERIWFYEYFKNFKEPSEDIKKWLETSYFRLPFRASNWKWAVFHGLEVENFGTGGQKYSRSKKIEFQLAFSRDSFRLPASMLWFSEFEKMAYGSRSETEVENMTLHRNRSMGILLANFWIFFDCKIRS